MTRHIPFQYDKPVFVKIAFSAGNHRNGESVEEVVGSVFKWKERGIDPERVALLYDSDRLMHNEELEQIMTDKLVGDGLRNMSIEALHELVEDINVKVKAKTRSNEEFIKKKCATSKIKDKQIGLIRRWRMTHGHME
jgi:hypothetical protein